MPDDTLNITVLTGDPVLEELVLCELEWIGNDLFDPSVALSTSANGSCHLLILDTDTVGEAPSGLAFERCLAISFGDAAACAGADAFLHRPFSLSELRRAVISLLASAGAEERQTLTNEPDPPAPTRGEHGSEPAGQSAPASELSLLSHGACFNGRLVKLSPKERLVLETLINADGEPISRRELSELLGMRGNAAENYIFHLRKKLAPRAGEPYPIVTVHGRGYAIFKP